MFHLKHLLRGAFGVVVLAVLVGNAQNPPAPSVDRVGFPGADYMNTMNLLYVLDRPDNKSIRTVYANDLAFNVPNGQQSNYPYGSVLVFESWPTILQDAQGNPILDANGRFQKNPTAIPTVNVMRKEKGFGAEYGPNRNGEWEYVAYTPTGAYSTMPQNSFSCAVCHLQAGGGKDWVFRASFNRNHVSGKVPNAVIKNYSFVPGTLHVKPGSIVTFYNDDIIRHNIFDDAAGGFQSTNVEAGSSIELKFGNTPFEWSFHCGIHPNMKGKIVVDPQ
jgi:plastocyanin